jgi:hypothetical protein
MVTRNPNHNSSPSVELAEAFYRSAEVFARKWSHRLPVATPFIIIDRGGEIRLLGNATDRPDSIALAGERLPLRTEAPIAPSHHRETASLAET